MIESDKLVEECVRCGTRIRISDFGAPKLCESCLIVHERERKQEADNNCFRTVVPEHYWNARIEDLPESLRQKLNGLPPGKGLFLWGEPGVGKTHAMAALIRKFAQEGKHCIRRVIYDRLLIQLRGTYSDKWTTEEEIIDELIEKRILFLEDVGVTVSDDRQESDHSLRTFQAILDGRIEACRPTFITSNKPVEVLEKSFDARIASRIEGACVVVKLSGLDRRRQKRKLNPPESDQPV